MTFSQPRNLKITALSVLLAVSLPLLAKEQRHQQTVTDLAYGSALYHLFQDKKLRAITDLGVAKEQNTLKNQPDDAELLLGGLYFEYGLPDDSEQILTRLLGDKTAENIKNRVWFNLARVQYEKNNYTQSEELLSRISEELPAQREAQKHFILSNLKIKNQQYEQAFESASLIKAESPWSAYAEYNLGVSLNSAQQNEQSQQWLNRLISRETQDDELTSLQNSARLLLGLSSLKQNQPNQAIQYFTGIHTSSRLTNKALLATGWAWSQLSNPQKALTYWFALVDRGQDDGATFEAYLAIANAYEQLDKDVLAIQYYEQALQKFEQAQLNMTNAIDSIHQMELINTLYRDNLIQPDLNNAYDESLPEHLATPYLHQMFASKEFQQALLNYQELLEIHNSLIEWKNNLPALELMLQERVSSFEGKRELISQTSDFAQLETLQQQRDELAREVHRIKRENDFLALAGEDEIDALEQLNDLKNLIIKLDSQQDVSEEKQKFRIMSGLLQWDISTDYPRRYWRLFRQLQLLDRALEQTTKSAVSLQQASSINEQKLTDFKQRISGQSNEIKRMEINASQLIEQQEQLINILATQVIEDRQQHLVQLRLSARYSLTRLYDELASLRIAQ